jgi:ribonucleoside-diphosphate reductase alpha chain
MASGPVSFMKIFDAATEHIKQGGKRRGANMGILNIDHPDIEEFINCKRSEGNIRNFNISVGITDAIMETLNRDGAWNLIHPDSHRTVRSVSAKTLWNSIVDSAWHGGDPGLIFLGTINRSNPTPQLGTIEATNPCGEVPLLPYESCNLGSINLSKFILSSYKTGPTIDWNTLEKNISIAIRFLDNVIDVNRYLSTEIRDIVQGNRKVGLGIMGWAETLSLLEIPYQSENAIQLAEEVMKFVSEKSRDASVLLAKEKGTFKNWEQSIYYPNTPIRNATRTSIAPTGTISIIADTSPSIEPFFALAYQRKHVLQNETLEETNKSLLHYLETHNLDKGEIITAITQTGTLEQSAGIPEPVKDIFKTALEIRPSWHLRHQAAFQKYTDNAVSKTVNLPQNSTPSDVSDIYQNAWRQGLKGITIFRNNSRKSQVMEKGITSETRGCKVCPEQTA